LPAVPRQLAGYCSFCLYRQVVRSHMLYELAITGPEALVNKANA
jgi:hypothetical protein